MVMVTNNYTFTVKIGNRINHPTQTNANGTFQFERSLLILKIDGDNFQAKIMLGHY